MRLFETGTVKIERSEFRGELIFQRIHWPGIKIDALSR